MPIAVKLSTAALVAVAFLTFAGHARADEIFPAIEFEGKLPACDSPTGKAAAISSFHNAATGIEARITALTNITALDYSQHPDWFVKAYGPTPKQHRVDCRAQATVEGGDKPIAVSYWFLPLSGDRIFVGTLVMAQ